MEPALRCRSRCTASVAVPSRLRSNLEASWALPNDRVVDVLVDVVGDLGDDLVVDVLVEVDLLEVDEPRRDICVQQILAIENCLFDDRCLLASNDASDILRLRFGAFLPPNRSL